MFHLQVAIGEHTWIHCGKIPSIQRTQKYTEYVLKCYNKISKKGVVGEQEPEAMTIICFNSIIALGRKILPSLEPTVLKYPAENPPLKAP